MQYFRNHELAKLYGVSQSAVGKWVEAARAGKLNLVLIERNNKSYIANSEQNHFSIRAMVDERKKYFNSRSRKIVTPKPKFYSVFKPEQVADITRSLEVCREIPRQYNYFDVGAIHWDVFANRMYQEETPNMLKSTIKLLELNQGYVDYLVTKYRQVNIIDLGPGNALPVRGLLERLVARRTLGRYLAIDISSEMLDIAKRNIKTWFGNKVPFESVVRDVSYQRFADLLSSSPTGGYGGDSINIVLFLGGTLYNFREPVGVLRSICSNLSPPDLFICSYAEADKRRTSFGIRPQSTLSPMHRMVFDLLNLDSSMYTIESGFDLNRREFVIRARLEVAVSIDFRTVAGVRRVEMAKNELIVLLRYGELSPGDASEQFESSGFSVLQTSQTEDHGFSLLISDVETER